MYALKTNHFRRFCSLVFVIIAVVSPSATLYAADESVLKTDSSGTFTMIVKVIVALVFIIGLFYLIVKLMAQKNKMFQSGRAVKTLGGATLGQNKSIQLVEIGQSLYVVGVGENVNLLAKIEDEEEVAYIQERLLRNQAGEFTGFQSVMGWLRGLQRKKEEDRDLTASFQEVLQNKLQSMSNRKRKVEELIQDEENYERPDRQ
jgi:flagellar protein FliO/FliZ